MYVPENSLCRFQIIFFSNLSRTPLTLILRVPPSPYPVTEAQWSGELPLVLCVLSVCSFSVPPPTTRPLLHEDCLLLSTQGRETQHESPRAIKDGIKIQAAKANGIIRKLKIKEKEDGHIPSCDSVYFLITKMTPCPHCASG